MAPRPKPRRWKRWSIMKRQRTTVRASQSGPGSAPGRVGSKTIAKPTGSAPAAIERNQAPGSKCASAIETALLATKAVWSSVTARSRTGRSVAAVISTRRRVSGIGYCTAVRDSVDLERAADDRGHHRLALGGGERLEEAHPACLQQVGEAVHGRPGRRDVGHARGVADGIAAAQRRRCLRAGARRRPARRRAARDRRSRAARRRTSAGRAPGGRWRTRCSRAPPPRRCPRGTRGAAASRACWVARKRVKPSAASAVRRPPVSPK